MIKNELTVEELLFNDEPIVVNRKLAKCLGLKEAVVFQQIHYWININKKKQSTQHFKEGKYWTYNSVKDWHENEFDFLSLRTVERTLKSLEESGLIESNCFNKMIGDKTKWYTINYDVLLEVCNNKLSEKEKLSAKRKEVGILGAQKRQENYPSCQVGNMGEPSRQFGRMVSPSWQNGSANLAEPIPETTTKTSTKTTISSSSKEKTPSLIKLFSDCICPLRKTTLPKFESYTKKYDYDFIKAIIEYGDEVNAKSYSWFEATIKSFIEKGIFTSDGVLEDIKLFRKNKLKKSNKTNNSKKNKVFDIDEKVFEEMSSVVDKQEPKTKTKLDNAKDINYIKENMKKEVNEISYNAWISSINVYKIEEGVVVVFPNDFARSSFIKKYDSLFKNMLSENNLNGEVRYEVN